MGLLIGNSRSLLTQRVSRRSKSLYLPVHHRNLRNGLRRTVGVQANRSGRLFQHANGSTKRDGKGMEKVGQFLPRFLVVERSSSLKLSGDSLEIAIWNATARQAVSSPRRLLRYPPIRQEELCYQRGSDSDVNLWGRWVNFQCKFTHKRNRPLFIFHSYSKKSTSGCVL